MHARTTKQQGLRTVATTNAARAAGRLQLPRPQTRPRPQRASTSFLVAEPLPRPQQPPPWPRGQRGGGRRAAAPPPPPGPSPVAAARGAPRPGGPRTRGWPWEPCRPCGSRSGARARSPQGGHCRRGRDVGGHARQGLRSPRSPVARAELREELLNCLWGADESECTALGDERACRGRRRRVADRVCA